MSTERRLDAGLARMAINYFCKTLAVWKIYSFSSSRFTNSTACWLLRAFAAFLYLSIWIRLGGGEISVS